MPDDEVVDPRPWSLDDVSDEALIERLKKIGFGGAPAASAPAPARSDDGVTQKILAALERLGEKNAAPATPAQPASPVTTIVEKVKEDLGWFLGD